MGGTPGEVDAPRPEFDEEQRVYRLEEQRLYGEEVAGDNGVAMSAKELAPSASASTA